MKLYLNFHKKVRLFLNPYLTIILLFQFLYTSFITHKYPTEKINKFFNKSMLNSHQLTSIIKPINSIINQYIKSDKISKSKSDQMSKQVALNDDIMRSFKPAKIIKQNMKEVVAVDFSDDGSLLYVADCSTLNVYNTRTGQIFKKLFIKNHEIQQLSHTHHKDAVLVATKKNNLILYWSIHDNKVIKMFKGHKEIISSLIICPKDDLFLTTSHDNTMRLWDLNKGTQNAILNLQSESMSAYPVANFDPFGVVFGVAWSQHQKDKQIVRISLYDTSKFETGSFADWAKDYNEIKSMKFSNYGNYILLATSDNSIILLDAFNGNEMHKLTNFLNESSIIECSFTPDERYIVSGSENGVVHVWDTQGNEIQQLKSHVEKVSCVKFSPNMCMIVSAGRNVVFWLPPRVIF